jgi:hypothetical protein
MTQDPSQSPPQVSARQVLNNPQQLEQLTERVYALMQEKLRQQQEQLQSYASGRGWT